MKLKAIFALFNGVLVLSFFMILFMPLFLGSDYFSLFWARNWIVAVVFVLSLGALNGYFLLNWRLFRILEREEWPALVSYLEDRILGKGKVRPLYVRLIVNAYLILSNTEGIRALEAYLREKKPALIGRFSLQFGVPYLLMKDPAVSEAFFASMERGKKTRSLGWVRWNHAFSLLQLGNREEAGEKLLGLFGEAREPVLRMLSLYLLDVCAHNDREIEARVNEGRRTLRGRYTDGEMQRKISKAGDNIEVVVLSRIVQDAREWLYAGESASAGTAAEKAPAVPQSVPESQNGSNAGGH
jgi:hypothetical protein